MTGYTIKRKAQSFLISTVRMLILLGICFVILYPLFMKISISFMSMEDLYDSSVMFFPKNGTLHNFKLALDTIQYVPTFLKTMLYVVSMSVLSVASALLVGYGFARFNFKGKNILFACVLLTLIIPMQSIMLPLYFYFQNFNLFGLLGEEGISLLGTAFVPALLSSTGVGLKSGLFIYMFRQLFQGFPKELEESGEIDGAGSLRIFFSIILPNATSMIVTCLLFSFVWQWTDTFYPSVFMPGNDLMATQLLGLAQRISTSIAGSVGGTDQYYVAIMSNVSVVLLIVPIAILYMFAQRFFVESIERSGIVG